MRRILYLYLMKVALESVKQNSVNASLISRDSNNFLWNIFNSPVVIISFILSPFLLISVVGLVREMAKFFIAC